MLEKLKKNSIKMLGTAHWLQHDVLVYGQYKTGRGWIRYPAQQRAGRPRTAFIFHCIHSQKYAAFHCEPLVKWSIER